MRDADKIIAAQFLNRGTKTVEGLADLFAAVRADTLKECCAAVCGVCRHGGQVVNGMHVYTEASSKANMTVTCTAQALRNNVKL